MDGQFLRVMLELPTKTPQTSIELDKFKIVGDAAESQKLEEMRNAAVSFVQGMANHEDARTLSLLGKSGSGKTFIARHIYRFFRGFLEGELIPGQRDGEAWRIHGSFVDWRTVIRRVRDGQYGVLERLRTDWFVVIDDLFAEYGGESDFAISIADDVISARSRKWTVVTSNLQLNQIADRELRIASRLKRDNSIVVSIPKMRDFAYRYTSR